MGVSVAQHMRAGNHDEAARFGPPIQPDEVCELRLVADFTVVRDWLTRNASEALYRNGESVTLRVISPALGPVRSL